MATVGNLTKSVCTGQGNSIRKSLEVRAVRTPLACLIARAIRSTPEACVPLLQIHTAQDIAKPRVGPETFKSRIYLEIDHPVSPILKSLVEPRKSLAFVFKCDIDGGDVIGRNVFLFGRLDQTVQLSLRLARVARKSESAPAYSAFISAESPEALIAFSNSATAS